MSWSRPIVQWQKNVSVRRYDKSHFDIGTERVAMGAVKKVDPNRNYAIEGAVGGTPLVKLNRLTNALTTAKIWVKCEWQNPTGSVKDRAAYWMIRDAEDTGKLRPGKVLLDSTSGNTGIALAQLAAARGHKVTLCIPGNASLVRQRLLKQLGANLILTSPLEGDDGARTIAQKMVSEQPDKFVYLDQYSNPMNWRAHYESTAEEIWSQTKGRVTHFVASTGTSGTFIGTSRRLLELNPKIERYYVQPDVAYHGIDGVKDYCSTRVPPIFDPGLVTGKIEVETTEAFTIAKRLAREEGLPAGSSGGAAVAAALKLAENLDVSALIVAILPDNVMKAISGPEWGDEK